MGSAIIRRSTVSDVRVDDTVFEQTDEGVIELAGTVVEIRPASRPDPRTGQPLPDDEQDLILEFGDKGYGAPYDRTETIWISRPQ